MIADPSQQTAEARPVSLRKRLDLVLSRSTFQSEDSWVVKDPLALKYIQLRPPEYIVFQMLDGTSSMRDMKRELDKKFPEYHSRISDIHSLITSFHENGLLIADASGQHDAMLKRRGKNIRKKIMEVVSSPLAIRFPGVDPDRFLKWLQPRMAWAFHPIVIGAGVLLCLSALLLVLVNLSEFYGKLPGFYQFFSAKNLLLMGGMLMVTKTIHELGHGLACKHYGGECHEIGVMLLVLMPAMYCNTTDSWTLRNKWQRISIGAAGMFVELVLAAFCTLLWWYSVPGTFHYLCLNIVFLCSFSTIVFNANPLLRYDGYYMLADWLEIPNMSQKSRSALLSWSRVFFLGMRPLPTSMLPERKRSWFALYAVAAFCYRWFIVFMILWFVTEIFEPWGLAVVGYSLAAMSFVLMLGMPAWKAIKFFGYPGRIREVKKKRFLTTIAALSVAIAFLLFVPLRRTVPGALVIRLTGTQNVYVQSPGQLARVLVHEGEVVQAGQELAILSNSDTELRVEELRGEVARLSHEVELYLRVGEIHDPVGREIAKLQSDLVAAKQNLIEAKKLLDNLSLSAPVSGVVVGPAMRPRPKGNPENELPEWFGSPLHFENANTRLQAETLFCQVGDSSECEARLVVSQSDVAHVKIGQQVQMFLDEYPGKRFNGTVTAISTILMQTTPAELTKESGGPMVVSPDHQKTMQPMFTSFEVLVKLEKQEERLLHGFRGHAKINVAPETLAWRIYRLIGKTFNFR